MASTQNPWTDHRASSNNPWLPIRPMRLSNAIVTANATVPQSITCQYLGFCLSTSIRMIATSNPRQEQIEPPREPVKSSAKKQVSAPPDRPRRLNARRSFARFSSNSRIDENRNDCCNEEKAEQNHRMAPAPMNVAAVL